MKAEISFLKLVVRSTFLRFMAIIGLMSLVQIVIFVVLTVLMGKGFEEALNSPAITAVAGIAFVLATIWLLVPWVKSSGSRPFTTLWRLKIEGMKAALCIISYNSFCVVIFWAAQLALFLIMSKVYLVNTGAEGHMHLISLAAWRVSYFHMLLPLGDLWEFARDISLVTAFGVVTGYLIFGNAAVGSLRTVMTGYPGTGQVAVGTIGVALVAMSITDAATEGAGQLAFIYIMDIAIMAAFTIFWPIAIKRFCRNKDEPAEQKKLKAFRIKRAGKRRAI